MDGFVGRIRVGIGINQASMETRGFSGSWEEKRTRTGLSRAFVGVRFPLLLLRVSFVSFSFVIVM